MAHSVFWESNDSSVIGVSTDDSKITQYSRQTGEKIGAIEVKRFKGELRCAVGMRVLAAEHLKSNRWIRFLEFNKWKNLKIYSDSNFFRTQYVRGRHSPSVSFQFSGQHCRGMCCDEISNNPKALECRIGPNPLAAFILSINGNLPKQPKALRCLPPLSLSVPMENCSLSRMATKSRSGTSVWWHRNPKEDLTPRNDARVAMPDATRTARLSQMPPKLACHCRRPPKRDSANPFEFDDFRLRKSMYREVFDSAFRRYSRTLPT